MIPRSSVLFVAALLLALATVAYAQMIGFDGAVNGGGAAGGGGGGGCTGQINLAKKCALPMLGGVP